jgi:hypothetical protein
VAGTPLLSGGVPAAKRAHDTRRLNLELQP